MVLVIWPMIFGAAVVGWIGWALLDDAETGLGKTLGFFLILCAGVLAWNAGEPDGAQPKLDHDKCSQYVWIDETWTCVPYGEEG